MADPRTIFRNFLSLGAAQAATMAAGFVTTIILGRALGPENFGILGFGTALLSYFGLAVVAGTDTFATREIARDPAGGVSLVRRVLGLRCTLTAVALIVLVGVVAAFDQPAKVKTVLLIQGIGVLTMALLLDFYFQGVQRMGIIAGRQTLAAFLSLGAVVLLVRDSGDLFVAAAIPVCATLTAVGVMLIRFVRETAVFPIRWRPDGWGGLLGRSAPFAVTTAMIAIYTNIDLVMLGFMRGQQELGWYAAGARVLALGMVLGNMMGAAFLPPLAAATGGADQKKVARNLARSVLFIGIPIAVFGGFFAGDILDLLFGKAFRGGAEALSVLMAAVGFGQLQILYGTPLIAWNAEKTYTLSVVLAAAANVALNLILIPRFGIVGAAMATLTSNMIAVFVLAVRFRSVTGTLHVGVLARTLAAAVPALAVAVGAVYALRSIWPDGASAAIFVAAAAVFSVAFTILVVVFRVGRPAEFFGLFIGRGKHDA